MANDVMNSPANLVLSGPSSAPDVIQARLAAIVTSSDDAIVSKDLNGIVQSWNEGAQRIFGYTAEEMIGQPINKLFPDDRQDEEPKILERIRRGERVDHFETVRIRKNGEKINVSVTISPLKDATGNIVGASKVARDITQLKRFMQEREELLESEQAARREAERVSRLKDEFLATLSHELRTPLSAILGWAQLLRTRNLQPQKIKDGLETIERNARIQAQLIDELLDVSRIISGKLRLDVQRIDLGPVVEGAVESMRPAADAKQIDLSVMIDPKAGPVMGDPNRLQQVFWNLLSNAIKFTPRDGKVQVFVQRVNSHVEITVTDTGTGIKPDFLPHLFTRFSQADASTTRRHGGLGLGLAIVRHLVEMHGGNVRAMSPGADQGSTFVITLPLSIAYMQHNKEESPHPQAQSLALPVQVDLSGIRVLIVDDEPDARLLVQRVLEANGAQVHAAESAQEALEILKQHRPNVLLSDIGMPGEDGYQLLKKVRNLAASEGGSTPAVALTAFARSEDRRRALLAGFQMHLPKPLETAELIAVVANLSGAVGRGES
jgi:PAS domain S-box-containing protein